MRLYKRLCIVLSALLALTLVSCGKKTEEPTAAQLARRDELAQAFMWELRDKILPVRSQPALLADLGALVSEEEAVDDLSPLEGFLEDYEAGADCALTVCFLTKGFVAARFIVEDGVGYYFRYEYSAKDPISVTPRFFNAMTSDADQEQGKTLLRVRYDVDKEATFTFREKREQGIPPNP